MTKPIPIEQRMRIVRAVEGRGMSRRKAVDVFNVSPSTVIKLLKQWHAEGNVIPDRPVVRPEITFSGPDSGKSLDT